MTACLETKAQEIACLEEFVATLPPDSYLAAIFAEVSPLIAEAIRNDFCTTPLRNIMAQKVVELNELETYRREAARQRAIAEQAAKELERRAEAARNTLAEVQAIAQRLTKVF